MPLSALIISPSIEDVSLNVFLKGVALKKTGSFVILYIQYVYCKLLFTFALTQEVSALEVSHVFVIFMYFLLCQQT